MLSRSLNNAIAPINSQYRQQLIAERDPKVSEERNCDPLGRQDKTTGVYSHEVNPTSTIITTLNSSR